MHSRKPRRAQEDDDDAGVGMIEVSARNPNELSSRALWTLGGVAIASVGAALAAVAFISSRRRQESTRALAAAFVGGSLTTAAAALLTTVGLRHRVLQCIPGLLSLVDFLPAKVVVTRVGPRTGEIALVGAGPGGIAQMTIEAYAVLQAADVVICDRILPAQLHAAVPAEAVLYVAEKIPGQADIAQAELCSWGIAALRSGRRVVRLKVGDPFLYGRGGEEVLFYRSQGFEPRVIPGLSSALAAPVLAGIPLTHRGVSNQVLISTGRDRGGALPPLPRYEARRTLVLLMAVGRLPQLHADLASQGYPDDAPVAVIERSTHPDERVTRGPLSGIAALAAAVGVAAPAIIVVGCCLEVLQADAPVGT